MSREELRNIAAIHIMAGARFAPDGASEAVACATPDRLMSAQDQAEHAVGLADALVAALGATPAKVEAPALDLHMTDDDPTNALADRVVREIQYHPAIRTEYAGVLQNAVIRALRPTVEEWRKDSARLTRYIKGANEEEDFEERLWDLAEVNACETDIDQACVRAALDVLRGQS